MLVEMRLCYIARMTAEATLNIMQLQTYNYMQLANHGGTYEVRKWLFAVETLQVYTDICE